MTPSPAYLAGRVTGLLVRPLLPLAESALAGVLDGLFGEPDALDATYTPTPEPIMGTRPRTDAEVAACLAYERPVGTDGGSPDQVWTLERDRIDQIAGTA